MRYRQQSLRKKLALQLLAMSLLGTLSIQCGVAGPLLLSNTQLDTISAGYVNLRGDATAHATGDIAIANINVDVAQLITHDADQSLTYTVSTITVKAAAIGETVDTAVSAAFDTNEKIVSLDVSHSTTTGVTAVKHPQLKRKFRQSNPSIRSDSKKIRQRHHSRRHSGKPKHHQTKTNQHRLVFENQTLQVTVVTTQPIDTSPF